MLEKLKIIIVCFPSLGGSGAVATELGIMLAKRGHKIHFISHDNLFKLRNEFNKNITIHIVKNVEHQLFESASIYFLSLANKIAEVSRRYEIDIIHSHFSLPHAVAAVLARNMPGTNAKVINTFHGTDVSVFSEDLNIKEILSFSIKNCDGLTAVAKNLAKQAKKKFFLDKNQKIKVIYNFPNPQDHYINNQSELRELFCPNNEKVITHISNFREVKRIHDVIEVFRRINDVVDSKLILIGDGPEQRIAHRLITKYNLISKVHVLGVQANVYRILSISDIFLLPSQKEGLSLAALEAMSMGVPVISTFVGGMPEMIQDGYTGFISKVGDVRDMSEKSIKLLTDPEMQKEMKQNILNKLISSFNADNIVTQYEKYYYEVLAKN